MMLYLIRHGMTDWNAEKRIQGRIDRPLSPVGITAMKQYRLSPDLLNLRWYCSPLTRARQSAEIMGIENPEVEHALTEMHWGDWEGQVLKPLRKKLGDVMRDNEARGLDFHPPNGETPRQVQRRLQPWLQRIADIGEDCGAVVHKGIIRAIYAMAFDWDMCGESPVDFDWQSVHVFEVDGSGCLQAYYSSRSLI